MYAEEIKSQAACEAMCTTNKQWCHIYSYGGNLGCRLGKANTDQHHANYRPEYNGRQCIAGSYERCNSYPCVVGKYAGATTVTSESTKTVSQSESTNASVTKSGWYNPDNPDYLPPPKACPVSVNGRCTRGRDIGVVHNWERIPDASVERESCGKEYPSSDSDAGQQFVRLGAHSYYARFGAGKRCFTLRRVSYDRRARTLTFHACDTIVEYCGSQPLADSWKAAGTKGFQTITQGENGKIYVTSMSVHGTKTRTSVANSIESLQLL